MADVSLKDQKLAAARKKLRKYQKRKANGNIKDSKSGNSSPYLELNNHKSEASSSRSSSVTDFNDSAPTRTLQESENVTNIDPQNPLKNEHNLNVETPLTSSLQEPHLNNIKKSLLESHNLEAEGAKSLVNYATYQEHSSTAKDSLTVNPSNGNIINFSDKKQDSFESEGDSVSSETNASMTTVFHIKDTEIAHDQEVPLRSTTESLRQLSLQMSGLVNDADIHDPSQSELTIMELEKRNNELAALLETEKQKSFQQGVITEETKRRMEDQKIEIQNLQKLATIETSDSEINGLREQLQVHIQTIGILVAEKSDLQTSLSHSRYALEQKEGEVTELQGRLDASREQIKHVDSLNRTLRDDLENLSNSRQNETQQIETMQSNNVKLSKMCDEMRVATAELKERLAVRSEESQKLNADLTEVRRQYELAQVHLEQLKNNSTDDLRKQFEDTQAALSLSQNEIKTSEAALQRVENEKKQMEFEYKSYTGRLVTEMDGIKEKLINATNKYEEIEKEKIELESKLESKEKETTSAVSLEVFEKEKTEWIAALNQLKESKEQIEAKCSDLERDNGQLSQLLAEQTFKLESLESAADRSSTQQVDTEQLLQSMQSDKIAAARALSQNKQLKEQLEELQNGFMMMSNKKLELTEKLERELHLKKSLYKEISQLEEDLAAQKENLLMKQRECDALRSNRGALRSIENNVLNKEDVGGNFSQQNGHESGHEHEQGHGHEHGSNHEHGHEPIHEHAHEHENEHKHDHEQGHETHEDSNCHSHVAKISKEKPCTELKGNESQNGDSCNEVPLQTAYNALEKRFLKSMKDLAAVCDEKQNLEHLVEKLQLETETIGDYITIYQFQRGVMNQQKQDLQLEVEMLKTDKQEILCKLSKLQKLVGSLSADKTENGFITEVQTVINEAKDSSATSGHQESTNIGEIQDSGVSQNLQVATEGESHTEKAGGQPQCSQGQISKSNKSSEDFERYRNTSKSNTMEQIVELISEMETSSQLDVSALFKLHPCPHCSGKLITV